MSTNFEVVTAQQNLTQRAAERAARRFISYINAVAEFDRVQRVGGSAASSIERSRRACARELMRKIHRHRRRRPSRRRGVVLPERRADRHGGRVARRPARPVAAGGGRRRGAAAAALMTVETAPATRHDVVDYITVVGNLIGEATVDVAPRVGRPPRVDAR